jgi:OFA family oxalate/formate antiporter-like MFS transporter
MGGRPDAHSHHRAAVYQAVAAAVRVDPCWYQVCRSIKCANADPRNLAVDIPNDEAVSRRSWDRRGRNVRAPRGWTNALAKSRDLISSAAKDADLSASADREVVRKSGDPDFQSLPRLERRAVARTKRRTILILRGQAENGFTDRTISAGHFRTTSLSKNAPIPSKLRGRWIQLWLGVVCMALIANLQYGWTLFVNPIHVARGWSQAEIQWAFSIFIATETWLTPPAGMLVDRLGPRLGPSLMIAAGGSLVGVGWVVNAYADALAVLYAGAAFSGIGAGAIYATCVGNAVRWFPDRRGLAVGLTAAGFGAGAAVTVVPIRLTILAAGYQQAFLWFGIGQALALILISRVLQGPEPTITPTLNANLRLPQNEGSSTSMEMLRSPIFWLLYAMFVCVSAGGLMATAQLAPIAQDYRLSATTIMGANTLSVALVLDNILNGLARPFFGGLSDRIGREGTMALAFTLGAFSYWLMTVAGHNPWFFVTCAGFIFFTWGEIFSLFPSTCTDTFGPKYATFNVSLLYTAKGTSVFLVPVANLITSATGSWDAVFLVAAATNVIVVLFALLVLRPMRARAR